MKTAIAGLLLALSLAVAAPAQAVVTLSSTPDPVATGASATVSWSGIPSPTSTDWITLHVPGAANNNYITWRYTTGTASGSVPFTIPATLVPSTYEFRLFANNGYTLLAISPTFTVTLPPGSPTVTFTPASVAPGGATVNVSWSGIASPTATDWIGLNPPGAPNSPILTWRYTTGASSGTVPFTIPSSIGVGSYQFRLFTNNTNNLIGISDIFTVAYPPKTISGTITKNGAPLSGVALSGTGATCSASDAAGQYSCTVAHGWSGTITPASGTFAFSPASRSYTNVTANQGAQDYAVALVTITGTITSGGSPLAGVSFSAPAGEGCTVSNGSGQYTCTVAQNWSGTVTPSFGLYVFSPASKSYSSIGSNQTGQDYAATPPVSISGTVTNTSSAPFAGATFSAGVGICTQSDAAGQYSCQVPSGWSGTVTPSQVGRTFTPSSLSYSAITTNQTAQDYAAAGTTASANIFYIQPDHLNTPRVVYDDQQRLRWKWEQDEPFGLNAPDENPSSLGVLEMPLRLPGQRQDVETGLAYNYFRDYNSSLGRYAQSDPIGLRGGLNTYSYVGGNPLTYSDPTGQVLFLGLIPAFGGGASGLASFVSTSALFGAVAMAIANSANPPVIQPAPATFPRDFTHNPGRQSCGNCKECAPPVGTLCTSNYHPGTHNVLKGHFHLFEMIQNSGDCTCRWNDLGPQVGKGVVYPAPYWAIPCPFTRF